MVIPNGVQEIGEQWFKCSEIENVVFPESVTNIGEEAFCGCEKIRQVVFANNIKLKRIGKGCFR